MIGNSKVYAWNCGGLRRNSASTQLKLAFFEERFKTEFDIFFFLETHHKDKNDIPNELLRYEQDYHIVHSQVEKNESHAGIIGLIHRKYTITNVEELIQGRILGITITNNTGETKYRLSAVYLPTNQNLDCYLVF